VKSFYIHLKGLWDFDYQIEANSKEEAISKAMQEMDRDAGSIYLEHIDQYVEEDTGSAVSGPGIGDMKISEEFFPKIMVAKYEE
jgi:hypothetical protein